MISIFNDDNDDDEVNKYIWSKGMRSWEEDELDKIEEEEEEEQQQQQEQ